MNLIVTDPSRSVGEARIRRSHKQSSVHLLGLPLEVSVRTRIPHEILPVKVRSGEHDGPARRTQLVDKSKHTRVVRHGQFFVHGMIDVERMGSLACGSSVSSLLEDSSHGLS